MKDKKRIYHQLKTPNGIAESHPATFGEGISNVGIVEALATLLEASHVGTTADLGQIPTT